MFNTWTFYNRDGTLHVFLLWPSWLFLNELLCPFWSFPKLLKWLLQSRKVSFSLFCWEACSKVYQMLGINCIWLLFVQKFWKFWNLLATQAMMVLPMTSFLSIHKIMVVFLPICTKLAIIFPFWSILKMCNLSQGTMFPSCSFIHNFFEWSSNRWQGHLGYVWMIWSCINYSQF